MKIVLASRNKHKIVEINTLLSGVCDGLEVLSLDDIGVTSDIEEGGESFEENSKIKACVPAGLGYIGIADDSGLSVDSLGGAPGVYSARYAGEPCDDKKNNDKLLDELERIGDNKRNANFVSVVTVLFPKGSELYSFDESVLEYGVLAVDEKSGARGFSCRGECPGRILYEERGNGGFGYDPLFCCELGKTFAELTPDEKNSISHRSKAMSAFRHDLARIINKKES